MNESIESNMTKEQIAYTVFDYHKFEAILLIIKYCSFLKLSLISLVSSVSNLIFSKITDNIFKVFLTH